MLCCISMRYILNIWGVEIELKFSSSGFSFPCSFHYNMELQREFHHPQILKHLRLPNMHVRLLDFHSCKLKWLLGALWHHQRSFLQSQQEKESQTYYISQNSKLFFFCILVDPEILNWNCIPAYTLKQRKPEGEFPDDCEKNEGNNLRAMEEVFFCVSWPSREIKAEQF